MSSGELTSWPPHSASSTELNSLLFNPKSSPTDVLRYRSAFDQYAKQTGAVGNLGLLTSGTTAVNASDFKIIVLRREAFEASALAVNQWIHASSSDRWSLTLPRFHVGGVSILVRASLTQSEVIPYGQNRWDPQVFHRHLVEEKISLVSLVPTQIFDLVRSQLCSPPLLRCVFVGGGELRADLWIRARELGWPLVLTFGMTEMGSQVACSQMQASGPEGMNLILLPHVSARLSSDRRLQLNSLSQLSARIEMIGNQLKINQYASSDWFQTEDYAELQTNAQGTRIIPLGRGADFVKINGENVSLKKLRDLWRQQLANEELNDQSFLFAKPDARSGHSIWVVGTLGLASVLQEAQKKYNEQVLPFERIQNFTEISEIPRSELGKVLVSKILEMIK